MYNKKEWVSKEVITKEALNNIENGIADLDERLEELEDKEVEVDLSDYQEKTDNNLVTESKDIVGAINELFQSANNGKEIIADAIGEPLNAEDTFAAMGNDINGLLATFKTNMMNSGVAVESSDKFKSLIDKIATMVGGNKGVQFASGKIGEFYDHDYDEHSYVINTDLDFVPTYIFVYATGVTLGSNVITNSYVVFSNINPYEFKSSSSSVPVTIYVNDVSSDSFTIKYKLNGRSLSLYDLTWYAIGVGEEDTTLRDSLASILEEEGVEVSEEDDMAGLISKVDNEFDRKNEEITAKEEELANSGGLDIISAAELPATGNENQICVITTGDVDKILVSNKASDLTNVTNNICVYLGDADSPFSGVHTVTSGKINVVYNIDRISYNNNNVDSHVYKEGQWVQLTQSSLVLMLDAAYINNEYGSFPVGNPRADNTMSDTSSGILMSTSCSSSSSQSLLWSSLPKAIDFGPFSKITASINVIESTRSSAYFYLLAFNSNTGIDGSIYTSNMTDLAEDYTYVMISKGSTGEKTLTFDVSNLTGEYYLGIALLSNKNSESGSYASSFHRAYLTDLSLR